MSTDTPTTPAEGLPDPAFAEFAKYFARNYPAGDLHIADPAWHAKRLFAAALHAMRCAPDAAQAPLLARIAELEQQLRAQPAGVPQGWKLVPDTPTQEMCQAGQDKAREWPRFPLRISPIYRAMLAAAPQSTPPQPDDNDALTAAYMAGKHDGRRAPQPAPEAGPVLTDEQIDAAIRSTVMHPELIPAHLYAQWLREVARPIARAVLRAAGIPAAQAGQENAS